MTSSTSSFVWDALQTELGGQEKWPDDAQLFQPLQGGQITLPDLASCLTVQTFLNMCEVPYSIEQRKNAEEISPSGALPFIKVGNYLTAGFLPIVAFVNSRGIDLSRHLSDKEKSDLKSYISLVETSLGYAELYISWLHSEVAEKVTKNRYGSVHPWPLNYVLTRIKGHKVSMFLQSVGWTNKSLDNVLEEIDEACSILSNRLGDQDYFFGDRPTELDALVFGHVYTLLTSDLPGLEEVKIIAQKYDKLQKFCGRIEEEYFHLIFSGRK